MAVIVRELSHICGLFTAKICGLMNTKGRTDSIFGPPLIFGFRSCEPARPSWPVACRDFPVQAGRSAFSRFSSANCRMNTGMQMARPISPLIRPGMMVSSAPTVHSQRSQLFMPTSM